jgi:hypothetical protein
LRAEGKTLKFALPRVVAKTMERINPAAIPVPAGVTVIATF